MFDQTRKLTFFQKIWNAGFNVRFKIIGYFEGVDKERIAKSGDTIYYLGEKIVINQQNIDQQNQMLYKRFSQTPWLTYRSGFPQLYHDIKGTFVTDTGWGCMIRVGQMAFAEIIREHRSINNHEKMTEIISLFSDFQKKQPFSIHNISKIARKQYGILPGDWYNPSQISNILSILNCNYLQETLKLSFMVFNSGNLFFDQIVQMMVGKLNNDCACQSTIKQIVCQKCNTHAVSVGLILLTRIGLSAPEEKYLSVLSKMMNIKQSKGMIGGKPGKALYFLGTYNDESYMYLDPHFVQDASMEIEQIKQSYFCGSFRMCHKTTIDPSIGICYYLRDLAELNDFYRQMIELRDNSLNEFFIWANQTTPTYLSKSIRISKTIELEEDHFQPI